MRARRVRITPRSTPFHHLARYQALKDDPAYIKALQRRATSNEKLGSWSALAAAQEGTVHSLLKVSSLLTGPIRL
jgi:hypothetical protein